MSTDRASFSSFTAIKARTRFFTAARFSESASKTSRYTPEAAFKSPERSRATP